MAGMRDLAGGRAMPGMVRIGSSNGLGDVYAASAERLKMQLVESQARAEIANNIVVEAKAKNELANLTAASSPNGHASLLEAIAQRFLAQADAPRASPLEAITENVAALVKLRDAMAALAPAGEGPANIALERLRMEERVNMAQIAAQRERNGIMAGAIEQAKPALNEIGMRLVGERTGTSTTRVAALEGGSPPTMQLVVCPRCKAASSVSSAAVNVAWSCSACGFQGRLIDTAGQTMPAAPAAPVTGWPSSSPVWPAPAAPPVPLAPDVPALPRV